MNGLRRAMPGTLSALMFVFLVGCSSVPRVRGPLTDQELRSEIKKVTVVSHYRIPPAGVLRKGTGEAVSYRAWLSEPDMQSRSPILNWEPSSVLLVLVLATDATGDKTALSGKGREVNIRLSLLPRDPPYNLASLPAGHYVGRLSFGKFAGHVELVSNWVSFDVK